MKKLTCRAVARDKFLSGDDDCFKISSESVLAIMFVPQKWLIEEKLSQDEKENIIEKGWQYFINNFNISCIYSRIGWSMYYVLVADKRDPAINAFKHILQKWKNDYHDGTMWRIAFAHLPSTVKGWNSAIQDIEWRGRNAVEQIKSQRLFSVQIGGDIVEAVEVD